MLIHTLFCSWNIHIKGPEGTLYDGEEFVLQFKFNSKYPFDSPQVSLSLIPRTPLYQIRWHPGNEAQLDWHHVASYNRSCDIFDGHSSRT